MTHSGEKPYGEIMDDLDHDAKYLLQSCWSNIADTQALMDEIIVTMRHARVFIASREKMHPTGIQLYDELLEKLIATRSAPASELG